MKKSVHEENKSLKTVYLYLAVVLIIVCVSLGLKAINIYQQSKFDSSHEFVLAITKQKRVKEIVAFHPETSALSLLIIQDVNLAYADLAKDYGIETDGYIDIKDNNYTNFDITTLLWYSVLHTTSWDSNLTILDKLRLLFFVKNISINNKSIEQISLNKQNPNLNTLIATTLNDQDIASESITIQVINATGVTGLGQRLGKVLTNMGANVVDVSSSQKIQKTSTIAYFGNESYTVDRLQKFLNITATKLTKQTIADIVITIGNDKKETEEF